MNRFAHHAAGHARHAGFDLLHHRWVALPLALWGVAMLAAVAVAVFQTAAQPVAAQAPATDQFVSTNHGA